METLEDLLTAWTRTQAPDDEPLALDGKVMRGSYDHDSDGTVRDEVPWQQLSAAGILSGLIVGQGSFTGTKVDAAGTILRKSLEPWKNSRRCVIADTLHATLETAQCILDLGLRHILTVRATGRSSWSNSATTTTCRSPCIPRSAWGAYVSSGARSKSPQNWTKR